MAPRLVDPLGQPPKASVLCRVSSARKSHRVGEKRAFDRVRRRRIGLKGDRIRLQSDARGLHRCQVPAPRCSGDRPLVGGDRMGVWGDAREPGTYLLGDRQDGGVSAGTVVVRGDLVTTVVVLPEHPLAAPLPSVVVRCGRGVVVGQRGAGADYRARRSRGLC